MKIVCYKDKILKAINSVVKAVASKTYNAYTIRNTYSNK